MKSYICTVVSNASDTREYTVQTASAMKAAREVGRCEGGEIVTVSTKGGKELSRVMWTPEDGGRYYRALVK